MVIVIKGLAGPYQNKHFRVAAGMGLGRRQGDILLEEDNTISSLHGRDGTRVYSKVIKNGISESKLTEEEEQVIKESK